MILLLVQHLLYRSAFYTEGVSNNKIELKLIDDTENIVTPAIGVSFGTSYIRTEKISEEFTYFRKAINPTFQDVEGTDIGDQFRSIVGNPPKVNFETGAIEYYSDGTVVGKVLDYMLRDGGKTKSFKWFMTECRGVEY